MNDRSEKISKLLNSQTSRVAYIKGKLSVLVPGQIHTLRVKSKNPEMPYQRDLAREAEMQQSRISMFETPGMANMTLETLAKVAAALRVGLIVKFVPFSDMLRWENEFSPDADVIRLHDDTAFLNPAAAVASATEQEQRRQRSPYDLAGKTDIVESALSDMLSAIKRQPPREELKNENKAAALAGGKATAA